MKSFNYKLNDAVNKKNSRLCVGLDISPEAFNDSNLKNLKEHTFNVIDATREFAVAYKPNFAFFERWGAAGFAWLEETVSYIGDQHIKIADAKRGDIGNTAKQYAESIFNYFDFDWQIDGRPAVMLVHGTDDQVVPFSMMEAASTILATHGIEASCVTRPGLGHGIDPDALTKAIDFLAIHMPD